MIDNSDNSAILYQVIRNNHDYVGPGRCLGRLFFLLLFSIHVEWFQKYKNKAENKNNFCNNSRVCGTTFFFDFHYVTDFIHVIKFLSQGADWSGKWIWLSGSLNRMHNLKNLKSCFTFKSRVRKTCKITASKELSASRRKKKKQIKSRNWLRKGSNDKIQATSEVLLRKWLGGWLRNKNYNTVLFDGFQTKRTVL